MTHVVALHVASLATSAGTTALLAAYAWRNRAVHGARAFLGLMVAFTLFSGAHLVGLLTFHPRWRLLWESLQWTGTALVPLFWLLFALAYTGYDEMLTPRGVAALGAPGVAVVALAWTNGWHGLLWARNVVVAVEGLALLDQTFGVAFWGFVAYAYALVVVGVFLLVRLIWVSDRLYADQSVLLVAGAAAPVVANLLTLLGWTPIRNPVLDLTPYAFALSGLAFGYALFRHRLFEMVPATRRLGRSAAIRDLEDGVVIVDEDSRVIYCNPTAADLFDRDPAEALGAPVRSFVDDDALDFGTEDALAEWQRGEDVYEVRTSPIYGGRDRVVGHTLVIQDVTARKRRERRLARQRDELERLDELNAVVRGVNRAVVSATSRQEIETAVCNRLVDSGRYRAACVADLPTWTGDADRWTVAGAVESDAELPAAVTESTLDGADSPAVTTAATDDVAATWTVVPLVHGRTVYGALGLLADREERTDREREVLGELGALVGDAIAAAENRQLLAAEAVVELTLRSEEGPLAAASTDARLALEGVVPDAGDGHVAYVRGDGGAVTPVVDALDGAADERPRLVRERDDGGLVEWTFGDGSVVGTLLEAGANVLEADAEDGTARFVVELPSGADVRSLVDRLQAALEEVLLEAKREHERPAELAEGLPEDGVEQLTDRQQEVLEVAYRAGYFDWPRESTAEEVADTLDISGPTLHSHLRKAEDTLLAGLFDTGRGD